MNDQSQSVRPAHEIPAVDPEIQQFADIVQRDYARFAAGDSPTIEQSRETAEKVRRRWVRGGPQMARVTDLEIAEGGSQVRIRVFEPEAGDHRPALIYLHGGGWTIFSLDTHDRLMREYAARSGLVVIGVDYSLAPEAKFPRQIDEVVTVIRWLKAHDSDIGIDPARLAIGGDSAGANMALATCLRLRDSGYSPMPGAILMNYGAFDASGAYDAGSRETNSDLVLTREEMGQFWRNYLNGPGDRHDPLANPIIADLENLPPAFLAIAECDILCDENLVLAGRLRAAGVPVESVVYPGATHSFLEAVSIAKVSDRALEDASAWLSTTLNPKT